MTWSGPGSKWLIYCARVSRTHPLLNSTRVPKLPASIDETHQIRTPQSVPDLCRPAGGPFLSGFAAFSVELNLSFAPWNQRQSPVLEIHFGAAKESSARKHHCGSLPDDLLSGSTDPARGTGSTSGAGSRGGAIHRNPGRSPCSP